MKKITRFITENNVLKELNKSSQIDLKNLQNFMRETQKDAETWKTYYKVLQRKNKDLFVKLQNTIKLTKNNDVAHSEDLQNRKLLNENNHFRENCFPIEGLLVI